MGGSASRGTRSTLGRSLTDTSRPRYSVGDVPLLVLYDAETRSLIDNGADGQSLASNQNVEFNDDGSADRGFGPQTPNEGPANWIRTVPGRGWLAGFRPCGPTQAFFDRAWTPSDITKMWSPVPEPPTQPYTAPDLRPRSRPVRRQPHSRFRPTAEERVWAGQGALSARRSPSRGTERRPRRLRTQRTAHHACDTRAEVRASLHSRCPAHLPFANCTSLAARPAPGSTTAWSPKRKRAAAARP